MATQQVFVALQCCQCSTMQVKQQKRSSNKWVCAVCNQKQSVRKVFARGYLARDVCGFVQRFNMSRMTSGDRGGGMPAPIGDDVRASLPPVPSSGNYGYSGPRRTDWSEYLDPDDGESAADASEEASSDHPVAVTEMPTKFSRRSSPKRPPNLRNTGGKDALKPSFPKRKPTRSPQRRLQEVDGCKKRPRVAPAGSSKWSEYLQEDPDEPPQRGDSPGPYVRWGGDGDGHGAPDDTTFEEEACAGLPHPSRLLYFPIDETASTSTLVGISPRNDSKIACTNTGNSQCTFKISCSLGESPDAFCSSGLIKSY